MFHICGLFSSPFSCLFFTIYESSFLQLICEADSLGLRFFSLCRLCNCWSSYYRLATAHTRHIILVSSRHAPLARTRTRTMISLLHSACCRVSHTETFCSGLLHSACLLPYFGHQSLHRLYISRFHFPRLLTPPPPLIHPADNVFQYTAPPRLKAKKHCITYTPLHPSIYYNTPSIQFTLITLP